MLLEAVGRGVVDRGDVSPFQVRQIQGFADLDLRRRAAELWPELKAIPAAKRERIAQLKARLVPATLASADLRNGRQLFDRTCAKCHVLFGEGGKIGPDLTGAQRSSLDYLLENVVDPSATLAADFRMSTIALTDGRVLDGIVGARTGPTLTVQTPDEKLTLRQADVEEIRPSDRSLMPDGLLDVLSETEVRDLVGYLMSPAQVPLPTNGAGAR
jgi:putative heme-binding domain-containing protein